MYVAIKLEKKIEEQQAEIEKLEKKLEDSHKKCMELEHENNSSRFLVLLMSANVIQLHTI